MEGFSGMVRLNRLDETALRAQERHGKRLDESSQERKISDDPPLTTTGLDLEELLREHEQGAARQAGSNTRALHMIVHFPTQLVDGADGELMLREARRFAEGVFGPDAVFADRCDRDEHSRHVVDLFIAPKYVKRTKKGESVRISMSRDLKKLAIRHGELNKQGEPDLRAQGRALQTELFEHLVDKMGLTNAVRGERKARAGDDWKTPEEVKARKIREAAEKQAAELKAEAEALKEKVKQDERVAFANDYAVYLAVHKRVVGICRTPKGETDLVFAEDIDPFVEGNIREGLQPAWNEVCWFFEMYFGLMADVERGQAEVEQGRREVESDKAALEEAWGDVDSNWRDIHAARDSWFRDRQKITADRSQLEAEKSAVATVKSAVETDRAAVDRDRQKITAERSQLEAEKSAVATMKSTVEKDRAAVVQAQEKLAAEQHQLKMDQVALSLKQKDAEKTAQAFITGVEAWHDGRITRAFLNDQNEKVMTLNCPTLEEKNTLRRVIAPAWGRIWDFVSAQMAHVKKLLEREKKADEAFAAAEAAKQKLEAARAATENVAKQLADGLARLPAALQSSAGATSARKALEEHQAVKTDDTAEQQWEEVMRAMGVRGQGLGR